MGNLSAAPEGVKPPAPKLEASSTAAAAEPQERFAAAQHRSVCVPPFEIIGLCGVALFFVALMFGARQTPVR